MITNKNLIENNYEPMLKQKTATSRKRLQTTDLQFG